MTVSSVSSGVAFSPLLYRAYAYDPVKLYYLIKAKGIRAIPPLYRGLATGNTDLAEKIAQKLFPTEGEEAKNIAKEAVEKALETSKNPEEAYKRLGVLRKIYTILEEEGDKKLADQFLEEYKESGSIKDALENLSLSKKTAKEIAGALNREFAGKKGKEIFEEKTSGNSKKIEMKGGETNDTLLNSSAADEAAGTVEKELEEVEEVSKKKRLGGAIACGLVGQLAGAVSYLAATPLGLSGYQLPTITVSLQNSTLTLETANKTITIRGGSG